MAKLKIPGPQSGKTKYQATEREKTALRGHLARVDTAPAAPRVKVTKDEKAQTIGLDHPIQSIGYALLMEALGTSAYDFVHGLLNQLAGASSRSDQIDENELNFMLSVIKDIKPRDQLEAMLAAQMAAMHMATMRLVRRLALAETILEHDSIGSMLNKLARTYTTQMETLKRYRTGGEQKVTVQHVSVGDGGQAIVGNVTQTGRENPPVKTQPAPLALMDAKAAPMPMIEGDEKLKEPAPVPRVRRPNR